MLQLLFDALFGCAHSKPSQAFTPRQTKSVFVTAGQVGTYVVCLECGRELPYDWQKMRVAGKAAPQRVLVVDPVAVAVADNEEFAR